MPMASSENGRLAPPFVYALRASAADKRDGTQRLDLRDEAGGRIMGAQRCATRRLISDSGYPDVAQRASDENSPLFCLRGALLLDWVEERLKPLLAHVSFLEDTGHG